MLQQPVLQERAAGVAAAMQLLQLLRASQVAAAEGGGGPPVATEAIGAGRWCGNIVWLVGVYGLGPGLRNGSHKKKTGKKKLLGTCKKSRWRTSPFSTGQHMGRPAARAVNSTGRPTEMAGRPDRARVSSASPPMSWTGPGRADIFKNPMGRAVEI